MIYEALLYKFNKYNKYNKDIIKDESNVNNIISIINSLYPNLKVIDISCYDTEYYFNKKIYKIQKDNDENKIYLCYNESINKYIYNCDNTFLNKKYVLFYKKGYVSFNGYEEKNVINNIIKTLFSKKEECYICYNFNSKFIICKQCGNRFCYDCFEKMHGFKELKKLNCPFCKFEIIKLRTIEI